MKKIILVKPIKIKWDKFFIKTHFLEDLLNKLNKLKLIYKKFIINTL